MKAKKKSKNKVYSIPQKKKRKEQEKRQVCSNTMRDYEKKKREEEKKAPHSLFSNVTRIEQRKWREGENVTAMY